MTHPAIIPTDSGFEYTTRRALDPATYLTPMSVSGPSERRSDEDEDWEPDEADAEPDLSQPRSKPHNPTRTRPGSEARIRIYERRYDRGEQLFHPADGYDDDEL